MHDRRVADHHFKAASEGWVAVPEHHQLLWDETLKVDRRDLAVYAEASWS
jgi:hypothetical protein